MQYNYSTNKKLNEIVFIFFFSVVIICKCLNISIVSDFVPYSFLYASYIIIYGILALFRVKRNFSPATKILICLGMYYLIWGVYNIYGINFDDAFGNLVRSLLYIFFIIITCYWVNKYKCISRFIRTIYIVFAVYLIIWFFISIPEINLIRSLSNFWGADSTGRYRTYFGFLSPNIAAEMAVSVIILSKQFRSFKQISVLAKYVVNFIMILIIIANDSRGSILALILFELLYYILRNKTNRAIKKTWKWITAFSLVIVSYVLYLIMIKHMTLFEILAGTNREAAIAENILLLKNSNRWLMGTGRLTGGFFANRNIAYGARTGYLEVFYFEVFITSGILGSIAMTLIMLTYVMKIIFYTRTDLNSYYGKWMFCIIIYMLFVSLFEVYFFSYVYATSMCFNIILLSYLNNRSKNAFNIKEAVETRKKII